MSKKHCFVVFALNTSFPDQVVCVTMDEGAARKAVNGLRDAAKGQTEAWKRYNHSCAYYTETVLHD